MFTAALLGTCLLTVSVSESYRPPSASQRESRAFCQKVEATLWQGVTTPLNRLKYADSRRDLDFRRPRSRRALSTLPGRPSPTRVLVREKDFSEPSSKSVMLFSSEKSLFELLTSDDLADNRRGARALAVILLEDLPWRDIPGRRCFLGAQIKGFVKRVQGQSEEKFQESLLEFLSELKKHKDFLFDGKPEAKKALLELRGERGHRGAPRPRGKDRPWQRGLSEKDRLRLGVDAMKDEGEEPDFSPAATESVAPSEPGVYGSDDGTLDDGILVVESDSEQSSDSEFQRVGELAWRRVPSSEDEDVIVLAVDEEGDFDSLRDVFKRICEEERDTDGRVQVSVASNAEEDVEDALSVECDLAIEPALSKGRRDRKHGISKGTAAKLLKKCRKRR